ncbi:MAG: HlyD family efflux transporter periplasmic adaptor subunit [Sphingopyxis sp.]
MPSATARASAFPDAPHHRPWLYTAVGRLETAGEARRLSASMDGIIAQVMVQRGELVSVGQPLLRVDCRARTGVASAATAMARGARASTATLVAGARNEEISAASALRDAAQAKLSDAEERLTLADSLLPNGFISRRDHSARSFAVHAAKAELQAASARLDQLREGPRHSEISASMAAGDASAAEADTAAQMADQCITRSPINGRVLAIAHRAGEFSGASRGEVLMIVGDDRQMQVRATISERDVANVHIGQPLTVWIEGQSERWQARVTEISGVMGRRDARSLDPTDRFDRDSLEIWATMQSSGLPPIAGLRVMIGARTP